MQDDAKEWISPRLYHKRCASISAGVQNNVLDCPPIAHRIFFSSES